MLVESSTILLAICLQQLKSLNSPVFFDGSDRIDPAIYENFPTHQGKVKDVLCIIVVFLSTVDDNEG